MFKLNEPLEDYIVVDGEEHVLDMAFDNVLDALEALSDVEMTSLDRIDSFLAIMIGDFDEGWDIQTRYDAVNETISHINSEPIENEPVDLDGNPMPKKRDKEESVVSFSLDAKYIYAAFVQSYGIDLIDQQGSLHWVKFSALLNSLPDNTLMRQIIDIRKTNLSEVKDKKEKARIRELKKQFALPENPIEEEGESYG